MSDRLSAADVSFLYMEAANTPMQLGTLALFEAPPTGFDYDRLVSLIEDRIALVPRYRQVIRSVPGRLANPLWVDDADFEIGFHVRRSALPRPGTLEHLREFAARILSRRLDRSRPLWEIYLVEGLEGGRFAILSKTHQAMVDGEKTIDLAQVILDSTPEPVEAQAARWRPEPQPGGAEILAQAVADIARRPAALLDAARGGLAEMRGTWGRTAGTLGEVVGGVLGGVGGVLNTAISAARTDTTLPLGGRVGEQRRFATADTRLETYRTIREAHGGTVNDVALATIAGALRIWLYTRGEAVHPNLTIRAMVPVSLRGDPAAGALGGRAASYLVDLPVGEANPAVRLHRISYATEAHREAGQTVSADALAGIAGFAPPTLHAVGARVAANISSRLFKLVITNVPGPQHPLYAAGARLLASYPIMPLSQGHPLAIGLTSYDGGVYFGLNADRNLFPDVETIAGCLLDALEELRESARAARRAARRRGT